MKAWSFAIQDESLPNRFVDVGDGDAGPDPADLVMRELDRLAKHLDGVDEDDRVAAMAHAVDRVAREEDVAIGTTDASDGESHETEDSDRFDLRRHTDTSGEDETRSGIPEPDEDGRFDLRRETKIDDESE